MAVEVELTVYRPSPRPYLLLEPSFGATWEPLLLWLGLLLEPLLWPGLRLEPLLWLGLLLELLEPLLLELFERRHGVTEYLLVDSNWGMSSLLWAETGESGRDRLA